MSPGPSILAALAVTTSTAATGCVGAHGTRTRAYAIDAVIGVAGGAILVGALSSHTDFRTGLALASIGLPLALVGTGGALLTAIGHLGEAQRDGMPTLVAVRPWTAAPDQVPFDPTSAPAALLDETRRAVAAARTEDCETALEIVDRLYTRDRTVHARLVRDPGVAWCIMPGGAP